MGTHQDARCSVPLSAKVFAEPDMLEASARTQLTLTCLSRKRRCGAHGPQSEPPAGEAGPPVSGLQRTVVFHGAGVLAGLKPSSLQAGPPGLHQACGCDARGQERFCGSTCGQERFCGSGGAREEGPAAPWSREGTLCPPPACPRRQQRDSSLLPALPSLARPAGPHRPFLVQSHDRRR